MSSYLTYVNTSRQSGIAFRKPGVLLWDIGLYSGVHFYVNFEFSLLEKF